jgi:hypothetical protein
MTDLTLRMRLAIHKSTRSGDRVITTGTWDEANAVFHAAARQRGNARRCQTTGSVNAQGAGWHVSVQATRA